MAIVQMVLPLIGVVLGAWGSYLASSRGEQARWERQQQARWDARRVEAYAEYGYAIKQVFELSKRIAAARGFATSVEPLAPEEGVPELARLAIDRASKWETVLLLGDPRTIAAARTWHRAVWEMDHIARGKPADSERWELVSAAAQAARLRFYEAARSNLGVPEPTLPTSPWRLDPNYDIAHSARVADSQT